MSQILTGVDKEDNEKLNFVVYLAFVVLACDVFTFVVGMCMIKCHKIHLDRTFKLALMVAITAVVVKICHYITLSQINLDEIDLENPSLTFIFLWQTSNKSTQLIQFVFLIVFFRIASMIFAFNTRSQQDAFKRVDQYSKYIFCLSLAAIIALGILPTLALYTMLALNSNGYKEILNYFV